MAPYPGRSVTGKNVPVIIGSTWQYNEDPYWLDWVELGLRVADSFECQSEEELLNYWFPLAKESSHA